MVLTSCCEKCYSDRVVEVRGYSQIAEPYCDNAQCQCHTQTFVEEVRHKLGRIMHNGRTFNFDEIMEMFMEMFETEVRAFSERVVPLQKPHICAFNDPPQQCECFDAAVAAMRENITRELGK